VCAAEAALRTDRVTLNAEERQYRRGRRYRKTWYRKARFNNRRKPEGWLAPSLQNKLNTHVKVIEEVQQILPLTGMVVEVAAFAIQRIKDPRVSGTGYQNGPQKDFCSTRKYVLSRDTHTCQHCKGNSKEPVLEVPHRESRQTGGDRPDNLVTFRKRCHDLVTKGEIALRPGKPSEGFKAETFMTMGRGKLIEGFRALGNTGSPTYGYITQQNRIVLDLPKSHINEAFVLAGGSANHRRAPAQYWGRQVRKCNRKLRRGERSPLRNTAPRFMCGFQGYDKVLWKGVECFIFGRRTSGYFALKKLGGTTVSSSAKASEITLIESAKTLLRERMRIPLHAGLAA
jgi:hypothetical protein